MKIIFRFLSLMKYQLLAASLGALVSIIASFSSIALMATAGWFITAMGIAGFSGVVLNIFLPSAAIRLFALIRTVLRYVDRLVSHDVTFKIISVLRLDLFTKALKLKTEYISAFKISDLERTLRTDIDKLELAYLRQFLPIVCAFIVGFCVCAWFYTYDTSLAWLLLLFIVLSGVVVPLIISYTIRNYVIKISLKEQSLNNTASDLVFGLFDLILLDKTRDYVAKFKQDSTALAKSHAKLNLAESLNNAFLQFFIMLTLLVITYFGINLYLNDKLTGSQLVMLAITSISIYEVIAPLSNAFFNLENVKIAANHVFSLVDNKEKEPSNLEKLNVHIQTIELKNVYFAYQPENDYIIKNLSLNFTAEKNYIIKGRSGIGKSTLINLLCGLFDVSKGAILINNKDVKTLDKSSIREHLSVATQEINLFSGSIRNIFTSVNSTINDNDIFNLLKIVELDKFILELPHQLDQFIGNTGLLLSGGQARRLCIARALSRTSDFLLLDEPTEGLDLELENRLMRRLLNLRKGIIIITHKDACLELADEIIKF